MSHSQRIVGLTKRGKEFFKLTSSLTETIQSIWVEDTRIWTGCENIYNLYDNGKDAAYFISKGQINDLVVTNFTRDNEFDTILACQDKYIRIIRISQLFLEIPTNYSVTSIAHFKLDKEISLVGKKPAYIVYGTSKGTLGMVEVTMQATYEHLWEIDDGEKRSTITCIKVYDINKDGINEIIIGRDDGRVEVYKLQSDIYAEPAKIFIKDIGQSVRSIECGIVNTPDFVEIVIASYSGKVISFTSEPIKGRAQEDTYGRTIQTVNNENRIKSLRKEVEELRKKVEKEREKLKKLNGGTSIVSSANLKGPSDFPVNSQFDLDPVLAAYTLSIELQLPIDFIILKSPVMLDLVESDSGNSVLSVTPANLVSGASSENDGGKFVAVFRCQSQERRLSLVLRTNEGEFGDLIVTIVAATAPKAAKIVKYELKPLSLHAKQHALSAEELNRPRNRIRYTGK